MSFINIKKNKLNIAVVSLFSLISYPVHAEDLGTISVQSTTIDDKFENKRDEPSKIGYISGKEIDKDHPQNIQDMLRRLPGVTTEVQNGDSLKIHIRGVENQSFMGERPGVAVVIDGVPVFERTGRVNIDLDNIESIKVIKGGASYLFGDDALAGAVIITTKRGADNAGVRIDAEGGSFGYYKGLLQVGFENDQANGHIQISRRETDGYYDDSDSKADYINGKLQYYIDDTSDITFGMELSDRDKNSHGTVRGETAADIDPKSKNPAYNDYANNYDVDLKKFFATYSKDFNESSNLMLNIYQFTDNTKFDTSPLDATPDIYTYDNDYDQTQRGIKAEFRQDGNMFAWMGGIDLRANTYENKVIVMNNDDIAWSGLQNGDLYDDNKTEEDVTAFYGELKFKANDKLIFTANARHDKIELDYNDKLDPTQNANEEFNVDSYRLGANYAFRDNIDFYASASTGFRTPTVSQLFVGNGNPSMRTDPNPNLDPEKSMNFEIGFRMATPLFGIMHDIDISIFQLDRDDYIQSTSGQYSTDANGDNIYDNIGDVRNRGLEISINSDYNKKVSWDIAYTYLDSYYKSYDTFNLKTSPIAGACLPGATPVYGGWPPAIDTCLTPYDNEGNQVPRTPKHVLNTILRIRPAQFWTISAEMQAQSDYYVDEINQEDVSGRAVFNLWANYDRRIGDADWSFFARVDNVFDRDYYNTARGYRDANEDGVYNGEDLSIVVNPGTVYTAGFSVRF